MIGKKRCIVYSKNTAMKAERYKWCDKQGWDYLTCPPLGVGCGMVCKTGILLVIETTWTLDVAFLLPWLLHRKFGKSTAGQGFWETES